MTFYKVAPYYEFDEILKLQKESPDRYPLRAEDIYKEWKKIVIDNNDVILSEPVINILPFDTFILHGNRRFVQRSAASKKL